MQQQLLDIVESAFSELNSLREADKQIPFAITTPLYGADSPLDSVDLVNLLVTIEEGLEDELDISFTIANEKALSLKNSPFKTVQSLCDYLQAELAE